MTDFNFKKFQILILSTHIKYNTYSVITELWLKFNFYFDRSQDFRMSSRKTAGRRATTKKRAQRATSNVFAMFDQAQIAEFKEAFNMIDQNHDGFIDKEDLHDMLASLGECFKC